MAYIPKIRFKGFTEPWEQRKFAAVFDGLQNNTFSRAELNYESGTVKNVHYGDVLIKFGDYIDASETELPYISDDAKADKFKNSFLQDGDIIIADTAEDEAVGKCIEIQGSEGLKLLSGLHTIACRPKGKYGPMFLGYYINSPAYHNQLKPLMQGIKVTSISKSALQDTDMIMPQDIEEQEKIGEYFSNLDHLITLHQRKYFIIYNKLITWEQRKVSDLLQERNEQTPMSKEYPLMAFIANLGVAPKGERYDRSALVNDEAGKKYKKTEYGDFIYSSNNLEAGSIGLNKYGNACISPVYSIFKPIGKADLDFLGRRFLRKDFINEMVKWRQGVVYGQWKIHESDFLNIEIEVPSVDEQKAIGRYLDFLDHLITLHQRKCDTLKELKKYMLQNMFPKKG
ncbi:restriction endonuclease subunit S [uncultured Eubacterium sp.]|uniref:restriction endonuclease subunit S n=1 Tax=uncultured Eubacterium sp. TaxID=165185 RepID=UPI00326316F0